jgi:hypothetical protein
MADGVYHRPRGGPVGRAPGAVRAAAPRPPAVAQTVGSVATPGEGSPVSAEYNRAVQPPWPAPASDAPARPAWARGLLGVALAAAFLLRVAGISYGLPDWVYHSDTTKQLLRVVPFMRGDLVPEDTYPVLHMYLAALLLRAGALLDPHGPAGHPSWPQRVVTVRLLNAALGTATVWLLAVLARRLFGWRVGLLAAGLLALSPVSIVHAHYEMGDVPQTFFVVAAVGAAATALTGGRGLALVATGLLAGLAAAAKFFGVVVIATAVVAALGGRRRSPARAVALLAGAGLVGLAAFVLGTPLLLLEPGRWLAQVRESPELFLGPPPPPLPRLWLGGRVVVGLALTWLGWPMCVAALAGAAVLARRGWAGALVLVTPAIVLGIYLWFRPHGLDDRYLVILAPFVAVGAAAAALALSRWSRRVAVAATLALLAVGAVDALHVAYLFWTDDTRQHALRWQRRHVPPGTLVAGLRGYAFHDPRTREAPLLSTDTQSDDRYHLWYSAQKVEPITRALERLEREGKLLRRFELLPRGFIAPTIALYDLESMRTPHAFLPPDAAASDEAVVFLDPDAVPDRAAAVVMPGHPRTWTLVSRTPLPRMVLALTGEGRLRVRSGLRSRSWPVDPRRPTLVELAPWREFPWFKPVYRLRLETAVGRVAVRLLRTPCEVAEQHLAHDDWDAGITQLEACRDARWMRPERLFTLAWARARAGQPDAARTALAELERVAPGLFAGLVELDARPDGEAWRARYAALVGRGGFTWHGQTFHGEAETTAAPVGVVVAEDAAGGGRFLRAAAGATPPGLLKIWLPQHFLRGRYLATFRVRAARAGSGPAATLQVVRHLPGRGYDLVAARDWVPGPGPAAWADVVLPVATDLEPVDVEFRVLYHGRGTLDVDRVTLMPDVRAGLRERLAVLRPLAPSPPD